MPWQVTTPQVNGRKSERNKAKAMGARLHPNSGSLSIKNDFSTDDALFEDKNVNRTHTIKGEDLDKLFCNAIAQGKEAHYIVYFAEADITIEGVLRRGK